jgi:hypothetical protein
MGPVGRFKHGNLRRCVGTQGAQKALPQTNNFLGRVQAGPQLDVGVGPPDVVLVGENPPMR